MAFRCVWLEEEAEDWLERGVKKPDIGLAFEEEPAARFFGEGRFCVDVSSRNERLRPKVLADFVGTGREGDEVSSDTGEDGRDSAASRVALELYVRLTEDIGQNTLCAGG